LAYTGMAALYVTTAWGLCRRFGVQYLPILWLVASLLVAVPMTLLFREKFSQAIPNPGPYHPVRAFALGTSVAFGLGFGLAALSVRRRMLKDPSTILDLAVVARGVGAFFCGVGLVLALFLIGDLRRLLQQ
jgi:hypothetical protein